MGTWLWTLALEVTLLLPGPLTGEEIFKNPGMEDADIEGAYGHAWGYSMERVNESHSGDYAVKLSDRTDYWMGIGQVVSLKVNTSYRLGAWLKLLNNNSKIWQSFDFMAAYQWDQDGNDMDYWEYGTYSYGALDKDWVHLTGSFRTPVRQWVKVNLYIQGPDPGIEYLADDMSLEEVPDNPDWKMEAEESIEQNRKGNFTLSVDVDPMFDPEFVDIEVSLKNHEFGFGSLIVDDFILDPGFKTYQNIFYEFFNWGTVQSYKWNFNKGTREKPDYTRAVEATDELRRNGLKVRGHNMFWGRDGTNPDWVRQLSGDELRQVIEERIEYMTNITAGKLEHWDVNNELLHGQLYEQMTGDLNYTQEIYRSVHQHDPDTKLFLNDYNVIANGASTDNYLQQALEFIEADVGLYGLGLQGHYYPNTAPDPVLIKERLDKLATSGLPLWITELNLRQADENIRADWFEDVLTAYFSHPAVDGVILWGFWDHDGTPSDGTFCDGNALYINAAGKRYVDLVKNRWSTHVQTSLIFSKTTIYVRGFFGDYDVIVRYMGKPIKRQEFSFSKATNETDIHVMVDGNGDEIMLPTPRPTTAPVSHVHHISLEHEETLGRAMSPSDGAEFTCTTRYSPESEVGDDKVTDVTCEDGEVMTDCSMVTKDNLAYRDGEYFYMQDGRATCRAVNAWRSSAPVQAVARCCSRQGLECTYKKAGPSGNSREDRIDVMCPDDTIAVDCTSYGYFGRMDGSMSNLTHCFAQNDGTDPVFVYASCCQATNMSCQIRQSDFAGNKQGDSTSVSCEAGETLLACSVFSEDGNTAGVMPEDTESCKAVNALDRFPGEESVVAVAVCCA